MLVPDIEKDTSKICIGCGETLLPHVIVCAGCKTLNKVDQRGTWSDYNTIENEEGIVVKGLFRDGNQEAPELDEEALGTDVEAFEQELSPVEFLPARKGLKSDFVRTVGALLFFLVLVFSLLLCFL